MHRIKVSVNFPDLWAIAPDATIDEAAWLAFYTTKTQHNLVAAWGLDFAASTLANLRPLIAKVREEDRQRLKPSKAKSLAALTERWQLAGSEHAASNLFPKNFASVLSQDHETGQVTIRPMRFHLRPQGSSPQWDQKKSTYKARLESLSPHYFERLGRNRSPSIWERAFKYQQRGLLPGFGFYQKRQQNDLHYFATSSQPALWPCLWDYWQGPDHGFYSFAVISRPAFMSVNAQGYARQLVTLTADSARHWLAADLTAAAAFELLQAAPDGFGVASASVPSAGSKASGD